MHKKTQWTCLSLVMAALAIQVAPAAAELGVSPSLERLASMEAAGSRNFGHEYDGARAQPGARLQGAYGKAGSLSRSDVASLTAKTAVPRPGHGLKDKIRDAWQTGWPPAIGISVGMIALGLGGLGLFGWIGVVAAVTACAIGGVVAGAAMAYTAGKWIAEKIQERRQRRHRG